MIGYTVNQFLFLPIFKLVFIAAPATGGRFMRRKIYILLLVCICTSFSSCGALEQGKTENVTITLRDSVKFTSAEIQDAIDTVMKYFKTFRGCELRVLWFDESFSNVEAEKFLIEEKAFLEGVRETDVIVLFSSFYAGPFEQVRTQGLQPDFVYEQWYWRLVRKNSESKWVVDGYGIP
ncbi:MAG: hypothetical protein LBS36_11725 [Oscillospiraceae bacterium]|jgi:hypothetical protein|nr:hypothetical protein [Oscillospiraceae bacterium]